MAMGTATFIVRCKIGHIVTKNRPSWSAFSSKNLIKICLYIPPSLLTLFESPTAECATNKSKQISNTNYWRIAERASAMELFMPGMWLIRAWKLLCATTNNKAHIRSIRSGLHERPDSHTCTTASLSQCHSGRVAKCFPYRWLPQVVQAMIMAYSSFHSMDFDVRWAGHGHSPSQWAPQSSWPASSVKS